MNRINNIIIYVDENTTYTIITLYSTDLRSMYKYKLVFDNEKHGKYTIYSYCHQGIVTFFNDPNAESAGIILDNETTSKLLMFIKKEICKIDDDDICINDNINGDENKDKDKKNSNENEKA